MMLVMTLPSSFLLLGVCFFFFAAVYMYWTVSCYFGPYTGLSQSMFLEDQ